MRLEGGHGVCGGDLDADGDLDLVVPRFGYHAIATFTNDGAAGFTRDQAFETGRNPTSVFCADLDGDGALDVLAAGGEGSNSSVIVALNTP